MISGAKKTRKQSKNILVLLLFDIYYYMERIKKKRYEMRSEPPLCSKSFVGRLWGCGGEGRIF